MVRARSKGRRGDSKWEFLVIGHAGVRFVWFGVLFFALWREGRRGVLLAGFQGTQLEEDAAQGCFGVASVCVEFVLDGSFEFEMLGSEVFNAGCEF